MRGELVDLANQYKQKAHRGFQQGKNEISKYAELRKGELDFIYQGVLGVLGAGKTAGYKLAIRWFSFGQTLMVLFISLSIALISLQLAPGPTINVFTAATIYFLLLTIAGYTSLGLLTAIRVIIWTRNLFKYIWQQKTPPYTEKRPVSYNPLKLPEREIGSLELGLPC